MDGRDSADDANSPAGEAEGNDDSRSSASESEPFTAGQEASVPPGSDEGDDKSKFTDDDEPYDANSQASDESQTSEFDAGNSKHSEQVDLSSDAESSKMADLS